MSDQITYDDKADLIVDTTIDDIFKVSASDMNEIKNVVNSHADDIDVANNNITDLNNNKLDINEILNQASTDTDKPYSADYLNDKLVSVGATSPTGGERVWFSKSKNLLNYNAFVKGRINSSTGQIEYADNVTNFSTTENTISFTATKAWNNGVASGFIPFKIGTYIIKGTVTGAKSFVYVDYYNADKSWLSRYSNTTMPFEHGVTTSYILNLNNSNASYIRVHFEASAASDVTITDLQLEKGATATPYEPYIEPSINVDEEEWYKKSSIVEINNTQPINGASLWVQPTTENLIDYRNFQTRTYNGIDIVNNHDGTFTINGTATADISAVISDVFLSMSGTWRMLGCPSGGSSSTYMLSAYVGYWGGGSPNIDTGNGTNITYTGNVKVRFYIKSGTTCNNLVFKPMLTTNTSATINDFVPKGPNLYALINGQYQVI